MNRPTLAQLQHAAHNARRAALHAKELGFTDVALRWADRARAAQNAYDRARKTHR